MGVNLVNEINNDIILGGEGDKKAQKYLFFALDEIEYGVDISIVDEIITMTPVSPIPSTKPFCKGVINIREAACRILRPSCELRHADRELCFCGQVRTCRRYICRP